MSKQDGPCCVDETDAGANARIRHLERLSPEAYRAAPSLVLCRWHPFWGSVGHDRHVSRRGALTELGPILGRWRDEVKKMNKQMLKDPRTIKLTVAGVVFAAAVIWLGLHMRDFFGQPPNRVVAFYQYTRMTGRRQRWQRFGRQGQPSAAPQPRLIYEFAGKKDRIQLVKYPDDPKISMMVDELPPRGNGEWRRQHPKWVDTVLSISDPVQQALTFASLRGTRAVRFWLISCGADSAALASANNAATNFKASRALLLTQEHEGLVHPHLLNTIEKNLAIFLKMPGDPVNNAARQHMARKIYREGNEYFNELQHKQMKYTGRYVEAIEQNLSVKVKTRITNRIERVLSRFKKG
jgi:hypothetical protein